MRKDIYRQLIYTGMLLFTVSLISYLAFPFFLILFTHFVPGFAFAFVLTKSMSDSTPPGNKALFILISSLVYIFGVFYVDIAREEQVWRPVKLSIASSIGAVIVTAAFDKLFIRKLRAPIDLIKMLVLGFAASLTSAICMYFLPELGYMEQIWDKLLYMGIFSIFPLWYFLIGRAVLKNVTLQPTSDF